MVAQALASRARRAGEMAARYGGEEFAVLLPQTDIGEACKLAEMICEAVRDARFRTRNPRPRRMSPSASVWPASAEFPDAAAAFSRERRRRLYAGATVLIETADHALYQAKMAGRNRVAVAGANDAAELAARSEMRARVVRLDLVCAVFVKIDAETERRLDESVIGGAIRSA